MNASGKLEDFFNRFKLINFRRNEIILRPDELPQGVFLVQTGFVAMNTFFADGRELILNIFKPGSFFPMIWAIPNLHNKYYFQAVTKTSLRCAPREIFLNFLKKNPDVLFDLTRRVLTGLNWLLSNAEYLLTGDARNRVCAALFFSAERFGRKTKDEKQVIVELPLTHQNIACMTGLTRETVSLIMKNLQINGIFSYFRSTTTRRLITIKDLSALKKEALIVE